MKSLVHKCFFLNDTKLVLYHQEGLRRTIDSYPHLKADVRTKRDGPSKAELLLGGGKGTDLFLLYDIFFFVFIVIDLNSKYTLRSFEQRKCMFLG